MAERSSHLLFDRVVIITTQESMPVEAFVALPIDVRIGYVLARKVAFYDGTTLVDSKLALASLRHSRVNTK